MRKLEKFQSSIDETNLLKKDALKSISGGKTLKSKYWCGEETGGNGKLCDSEITIDRDYDDGSTTSETETIACA